MNKCGNCIFFQNISKEFSLEELAILNFEIGMCHLKFLYSKFYEKYSANTSPSCEFFIDKNDKILIGIDFNKEKNNENNLFGRFTL